MRSTKSLNLESILRNVKLKDFRFSRETLYEVERIYPNELEIKDITDTDRSASYLDLYIEIVSEGRLRTKH
jgi:hypothetical protein